MFGLDAFCPYRAETISKTTSNTWVNRIPAKKPRKEYRIASFDAYPAALKLSTLFVAKISISEINLSTRHNRGVIER
jgi:hypothetical protein